MSQRFLIISCLSVFLSGQLVCQTSDSPKQISKAGKIHRQALTIDSHNDTPIRMTREGFDIGVRHDPYKENSKVDLVRMKEGGLDGAFFAVFLSQGPRNAESRELVKQRALIIFDTLDNSFARVSDLAGIAGNPADASSLEKQGKIIIFKGIENGYPIGLDLSNIALFYQRGARYITLCHTKNNDICDSSTDTLEHGGLSEFGKEVVKEMNRTGMMIDVSHISDQSFYDVLAITASPVIASHSCARALCDNPRNLDDQMLIALAENGGVIQMCILSDYVKKPQANPNRDSLQQVVREKYRDFRELSPAEMKQARKEWYAIDTIFPPQLASVQDVVDHIDHIVEIAGIDHVGIGTDFDGGGGVQGCFDVSEMGNITLELVRRGYSKRDIRKIWSGNLMRVMNENFRIAATMH